MKCDLVERMWFLSYLGCLEFSKDSAASVWASGHLQQLRDQSVGSQAVPSGSSLKVSAKSTKGQPGSSARPRADVL